jgi:hypothetical protein
MTKRRGDKTPEPPGGRAAERLRMFEDARRPKDVSRGRKKRKSQKDANKGAPVKKKEVTSGEEQDRCKD